MADEKMERSLRAYQTICKALDLRDFKYEKDDENLKIRAKIVGDDLPMDIGMYINEDIPLAVVYSFLPFTVPEDKRVDMAVAITVINNNLINGHFEFDIVEGDIKFRMTSSFAESEISIEAINYMFMLSALTIDDYNDKLFMLSNNLKSLEEIVNDL